MTATAAPPSALPRSYGRDRTLEAVALLNVVERRISDLWGYRAWFRTHRWADWPAERGELDREMRALVSLLREARRRARGEPDPTTAAGAYRDWTEAEMREAHGGR